LAQPPLIRELMDRQLLLLLLLQAGAPKDA